jgi:membrane protein
LFDLLQRWQMARKDAPLNRSGSGHAPPPVSPAEYWTYLATASLVAAYYIYQLRQLRVDQRAESLSRTVGKFHHRDERQISLEASAREYGRGRDATAPWQIPLRGWKDILWRTYQQVSENRLLAVAAGMVFYGLLALFPAITAVVSLYGLFANAATINDYLSSTAVVLPAAAIDVVHEQIVRLTSNSSTKLGFAFISGIVIALWSANAGMKSLIDALNVVYGEKEKRGFFTLNVISLTFTLGVIILVLLGLGAVVILPLVLSHLGLADVADRLFRYTRWPILLAAVIVGLATIYRFGPSRRLARWQWLSVGTLLATAAWMVSSALLSWYLSGYAHYDVTYGSLGTGIGLMMWMWLSAIVVLFGAQLNSEIEHQTARDSTVADDRPLGGRGAVMADNVGRAA